MCTHVINALSICIHPDLSMHLHSYIHSYVHTYEYIYQYIYIHIYIYIYIHIYIFRTFVLPSVKDGKIINPTKDAADVSFYRNVPSYIKTVPMSIFLQ